MQSISNVFCLQIYIVLLLLLPSRIHLINGFYVKNCNIRGSLTDPQDLKILCGKRKLSSIPDNLPNRGRVLDVSENAILVIKKTDLMYLFDLTHLNVSHNVIHDIEEGAFSSLVALEELNIAYNRLTSITSGLFQNLSNLTVLRLDANQITNISPSAFLPLINVLSVNISRNYLDSIQQIQALFTLPNIQNLYLGSNRLTSFQTFEVSNTSLKLNTLDLSGNPLQLFRVTADIFPQLQKLDLAFINVRMKWDVQSDNYFRNVKKLNLSKIAMPTEEIRALLQSFNFSLTNLRMYNLGESRVKPLLKDACLIHSLRTLRLEANKVSSITEKELQHCTTVTTLDLSGNSLTDITNLTFTSMRRLDTLNLSHNKLKGVPSAIRSLSTLENLDISYNEISTLTCLDFVNLEKLMILYIYRNNLYFLENCTFQNLNNLRMLKLSSNKLLSLKGYFTSGLKKLDYLQVAHNKLNTIHQGDFKCLHSLRRLELNDNQIQNIEMGAFDALRNLEYLDLQSNKITKASLIPLVFSGIKQLKSLLLNNNHISYESTNSLRNPPFKHLYFLRVLTIYSQGLVGMLNIPANFLEGLTNLRFFMAGNLNIKSLHSLTFTYTPNLYFLDLSKNLLESLSSDLFLPIQNITRLYMTGNGLQSIDFLGQANLTQMKFLQLQKNALSVINKTMIVSMPNLLYLDLERNDFSCDCVNAWFIRWAISNKATQIINADQFMCNYPPKLRGNKLMKLNIDSCTVDVGYFCFISTITVVLLTLFGSFLYHFLYWQVVYAYYLFLAYLYDKKQHKKHPNLRDFQYDAFISYNTHDESWVVRELLPQLEGQQGWRLCLHHRDFQPGKPIIDNIVDGIYSSRKTICVISHHYLESEWCSKEIQVASFRLFDEKKDVLIMVFLEDIPSHQLAPYCRIRSLIKKHTYLSWPKPGEDSQVFWQKIKVALKNRHSPKE